MGELSFLLQMYTMLSAGSGTNHDLKQQASDLVTNISTHLTQFKQKHTLQLCLLC